VTATPHPDLFPDARPRVIAPETSQEFFELCARADRGELRIEALEWDRKRGNGAWRVSVEYLERGV
jgi:hypothetical protein